MKRVLCIVLAIAAGILFTGCGGGDSESSKKYDVVKAGEEIKSQIESAAGMTEINEDILASFYGIEDADINSFFGLISTDSVKQDEVIIVEAKDSEAFERVEEKINTRYDSKYVQTKDYLPEEAKLIEECKVESDGNYVWMFISEDAAKMKEILESTAS